MLPAGLLPGDRPAEVLREAAVARLKDRLAEGSPVTACRLVKSMALVLQDALLVRHAPAAVADAFRASRLGGDWGHAFGTLPASADLGTILERALPDAG